jgi:hypothetical protein
MKNKLPLVLAITLLHAKTFAQTTKLKITAPTEVGVNATLLTPFNVTAYDVSALPSIPAFTLPPGTFTVTITNAYKQGTTAGNEQDKFAAANSLHTTWSITGSIPFKVQLAHGANIPALATGVAGGQDGLISTDGKTYTPSTANGNPLDAGFSFTTYPAPPPNNPSITTGTVYAAVSSSNVLTANASNFVWTSDVAATTADFQVYTANLNNNPVNIYDVTIIYEAAILPVKITSFSVSKLNNDAILNWSTAQEIDINSYVVQRSTNGILFEEIGTKPPTANNTGINASYSFIDIAINKISAATLYYRLKTSNLNGSAEFSDVRLIKTTQKNSLLIYPNPGNGVFVIPAHQLYKKLIVTNSTGAIVLKYENSVPSFISLNKLPNGLYYLNITDNSGEQQTKILEVLK